LTIDEKCTAAAFTGSSGSNTAATSQLQTLSCGAASPSHVRGCTGRKLGTLGPWANLHLLDYQPTWTEYDGYIQYRIKMDIICPMMGNDELYHQNITKHHETS